MMFLTAVAAIIATMILVVGIHEAGHALAARLFGISIQRISIGFGTPLLRWRGKNGIEWVYALWPFGGYVQLLNTRIQPIDENEFHRCFDKQPVWKRIIVLLSGSIMNFLFASILLTAIFYVGLEERIPLTGQIMEKSIAAQSGMITGDRILKVNHRSAPTWREIGMEMILHVRDENLSVTVQDSTGNIRDLILNLQGIDLSKRKGLLASLGIIPDNNAPKIRMHSSSLLTAFTDSFAWIFESIGFYCQILWKVITGVLPFSLLLGPLGFFTLTIQSFAQGLLVFMFFIAGFSVAVGLVNLFPVPGLDGGSIGYSLLEKIRGKPVSVAMEVLLHRLVLIIVVVLFVQLVLNDLLLMYVHSTK